MQRKKTKKIIILASWSVILAFIYLVLILQIISFRHFALGVKIADVSLGNKDFITAQALVTAKEKSLADLEIKLLYSDKSWLVKINDFGYKLNFENQLNSAYDLGKSNNVLKNAKENLLAFFRFYNLSPDLEINKEQFKKYSNELFNGVESPAQNASLIYDPISNDFLIKLSSDGWIFDRQKLLSDLSQLVHNYSIKPIYLNQINDYALVKENKTSSSRTKAKELLNNLPFQLKFNEQTWLIDKNTLLSWLVFEPVKENDSDNYILGVFLNQKKVGDWLTEIAKSINQPSSDAKLVIENDRATIFSPAENGRVLNILETSQVISRNIFFEPIIKETNLIVATTSPEITLDKTNNLGINQLLAEGVSDFKGSAVNRIHNIKIGTNRFNGVILKPNEEFSFNAILGEVGPDQGYLQGLVIKKGETVPEYGGGLCQVSTTIFRAAVNTGLKIIERAAHAFPVSFYNPQGFDATIYSPHPDLRFINNTPSHILIQGYVKDTKVYFKIYGTSDQRQVKITGPVILEKNSDGSMKTVLTQEVFINDESILKSKFYSNYKSPSLYPQIIAPPVTNPN